MKDNLEAMLARILSIPMFLAWYFLSMDQHGIIVGSLLGILSGSMFAVLVLMLAKSMEKK